jgi:hypothetical protein
MTRAICLATLVAAGCACGGARNGSDAGDDADAPGEPALVGASGNAFFFGPPGGRIEGGVVTMLEFPGPSVVTGAEGEWAFDGLPEGARVSFVMTHPDHPTIQTGTITLPAHDVEKVSFQAPDWDMYGYLSDLVGVEPGGELCQIATTVTRMGNSLYDTTPGTHGEPGATVTIDPPLPDGRGPIYFDLITAGMIFPNPDLAETTDDGGVLWVNVPPGEYVLRADKPDTVFTEVLVTCRPGLLVNASPPWGLQAIEGGVGPGE